MFILLEGKFSYQQKIYYMLFSNDKSLKSWQLADLTTKQQWHNIYRSPCSCCSNDVTVSAGAMLRTLGWISWWVETTGVGPTTYHLDRPNAATLGRLDWILPKKLVSKTAEKYNNLVTMYFCKISLSSAAKVALILHLLCLNYQVCSFVNLKNK